MRITLAKYHDEYNGERVLCDTCATFCPSTPDKCNGCERLDPVDTAPDNAECDNCGNVATIDCFVCSEETPVTECKGDTCNKCHETEAQSYQDSVEADYRRAIGY